MLLSDWLAGAVRGHTRDAETFEILLYKARCAGSYDDVAGVYGLSPGGLRCRVGAFKEKSEPEWRRHRAFLVLLILGALALVAIAAWRVLTPSGARFGRDVAPPAQPPAPRPRPSATAEPPDTPFEPAAPTRAPAPPRPQPTEQYAPDGKTLRKPQGAARPAKP